MIVMSCSEGFGPRIGYMALLGKALRMLNQKPAKKIIHLLCLGLEWEIAIQTGLTGWFF